MTDVITPRWKKRHCEMRATYVAFCHSEEAFFREKTWGYLKDLLTWIYKKGAQALGVYSRNNGLRRGLCTVKTVRNLIYKFEGTDCTCDRPWFGRPSVAVETVAEVHQTISTVCPTSACCVSHVLHQPNSTVCKILCSVLNILPFRFQRIQMLKAGDYQLH